MRDARDADAGIQASLELDEDPEIGHDLEAMKNLEKECDKILQRQAKEDEECKKAQEKALEEMSEEELKVWCQQKEALIKEQEKKKKTEEKVQGGSLWRA